MRVQLSDPTTKPMTMASASIQAMSSETLMGELSNVFTFYEPTHIFNADNIAMYYNNDTADICFPIIYQALINSETESLLDEAFIFAFNLGLMCHKDTSAIYPLTSLTMKLFKRQTMRGRSAGKEVLRLARHLAERNSDILTFDSLAAFDASLELASPS